MIALRSRARRLSALALKRALDVVEARRPVAAKSVDLGEGVVAGGLPGLEFQVALKNAA